MIWQATFIVVCFLYIVLEKHAYAGITFFLDPSTSRFWRFAQDDTRKEVLWRI